MKETIKVTPMLGIVLVFLGGVMWSTIGLAIRLMEDASVWQILFYRSFSLTIFLFFIIVLLYKENPFYLIYKSFYPSLVGGVSLFIAYSFGIYSIQTTSVAHAILLFATAPFITAFLGWIFLRERVKLTTWIALIFAIFGIILMVSGDNSNGKIGGNISAFISAFGFASFTIALRWGKSGNMLSCVFLSGILGVIFTYFICLVINLSFIISINDATIALMMGVFQVGAGLVLYTLGSKTISGAELALLSMSEPLLGPLWVWIFIGEHIDFNTILGGLILLLAIFGNAFFSIRNVRYNIKNASQ